jgi:hypothetical protein
LSYALRQAPPNKRMQLAGASLLRNLGLCPVEESPQLMRGPLGGRTTVHGDTGVRPDFSQGGSMPGQQCALATAILLLVLAQPAATQEAATQPGSAPAQIHAVLRAYYMNLTSQNWMPYRPMCSRRSFSSVGVHPGMSRWSRGTKPAGADPHTRQLSHCRARPVHRSQWMMQPFGSMGIGRRCPYSAVTGLRRERTSFGCSTLRMAGGSSTPTSLRRRRSWTVNDRFLAGAPPNKRMRLADASTQRNVGWCSSGEVAAADAQSVMPTPSIARP